MQQMDPAHSGYVRTRAIYTGLFELELFELYEFSLFQAFRW